MARARIEILGDSSSFAKAAERAALASDRLGKDMKQLGVTAKSSADLQIKASLRKETRLKGEISAYRAAAAAAVHGSREQVTAANLATKAEGRLAHQLGTTTLATRKLGAASAHSGNELGRFGRGALVGTGALHGLGRAAAFASTSFIGGAGLIYGMKAAVGAAVEQSQILANLRNSLSASGISWATYGNQIEDATAKTKAMSAFDDEELYKSLQLLVRGTGDVNKALKLNSLAADVARGRNIGLVQAAQLLVRVNAGQVGSLRRLGIQIDKGVSGTQALIQVQKQYAGAAQAFTRSAIGAQTQLSVAVGDTEKAIGRALLPTVKRYEIQLSSWLGKAKNQKRIEHDVKEAVHAVGVVTGELTGIIKHAAPVVKTLTGNLGGLKGTVFALGGVMAALRFGKMLDGIGGIALKSKVASGEVKVLSARLGTLRKIGPIGVTIAVGYEFGKAGVAAADWLGKTQVGKAIGAGNRYAGAADGAKILQSGPGGAAALKQMRAIGMISQDDYAAAQAKAGKAAHAYDVHRPPVVRRLHLPGTVSGSASTGRSGLSGMQRSDLALSAAGRTATTADDLAALRAQRGLLEKAIATETARLNSAPNAKAAAKFADNLQSLEAQDSAALGQITSIEQAAAARAKTAADKITAAAKKQRHAIEAAAKKQRQERERTAKALAAISGRTAASLTGALAGKPGMLEAAVAGNIRTVNQQRQFAALGLSKTGQGQSPLAESLKHELARVKGGLAGTLLDTNKNRSLLGQIGKALDGQFGVLTDKTRSAARKLMDALDGELKKGGERTKFHHLSSAKFVAGLGLDPAQAMAVRSRFAQTSAGGVTPGRTGQFAAAHGGGVTITGPVHVHGVTDVKTMSDSLDRYAARRSGSRRGPTAGR